MALFDPPGSKDSQRRALIGRPSLRRQLRGLSGAREDEVANAVAQQTDPGRWKDLYRQRLSEAIGTEQSAAPLVRRDAADTLLRSDSLDPEQRAQISGLRRDLPGQNSAEGRFDPRNPNSLAFRRYGGLFRNSR